MSGPGPVRTATATAGVDGAPERAVPGDGALVRAAGISGGYVRGHDVLRDVTFAAGPGQGVALLGANGGGKSTLLRALLGELPVRHGELHLQGRPAYVPQTERARLDFPVDALDVVLMGAYARTPWWRPLGRATRDRAREALARVGLADRERSGFGTLSGGQRQRVLVARALMQDAKVILLDEPLSGVDRVSASRIEAIFGELLAEGRTVLIATHDVAQARRLDRVLCLNGRQIAFGPAADVLTPEVLRETYGGDMISFGEGDARLVVEHHGHSHPA